MNPENDDIDEEIRTLISESIDLANELIAVTVQEELGKTKLSVLKELENEVENYGRQIANYTNRLQRLELLEQGVLHRLNQCCAFTKEFDLVIDSFQAKVAQLDELLEKSITFECSKLLAKEVFQKLYGYKEELNQLEIQIGQTVALINEEENREVVQTLSHLKRKTSKVKQDMENLKGLNSMHKQTVVGFSNKIYYDVA
ncbi:uncharacterized protein LOC129771149 [Toxorhynchites rutilus septentrionalis]|uniref:uncharacterized protein LOC129771149 n=1 Tax=Toxorhynchites rutilus septentrionalis TaxID=329112 RepID=UPI002479DB65|nr:uncharacterized protein LOC129771149 [Toxorhynchites rutilus septentrionalis]